MVGLATFMGLSLLAGMFLVGLMYANLIKDLPPVGNIELLYGKTADGFLEPVQVYDREGIKLFDLNHPLATNRRWMRVSGTGSEFLPREVIDAAIASQDESFWNNRGYDLSSLFFAILRGDWKASELQLSRTITQRLVAMTILPAEDLSGSPLRSYFREAILAQRLTERYNKEQILEWYLNTAGFGHLTSGIDAAALVYFGKHSGDLSLAEGAYLVGLSQDPAEDFSADDYALEFDSQKERQEQVLRTMERNGLISGYQYRSAIFEVIKLNSQNSLEDANLQDYVWNRLDELLGPDLLHRANLQVYTSIDYALQIQVGCTAETYLNQLSIQSADLERMSSDMEDCVSTSILQRTKLGEVDAQDTHFDLASIVLNPESGEILSYHGPADLPVPSGSMLYPLIYLTSFSRGNSPGTMVLDLPSDTGEGMENVTLHEVQPYGPIRMRTALIGGYPFAAQRTILSTGLDAVLQVIQQMGIANSQLEYAHLSNVETLEMLEVSLMNVVFGYGVIANEGKMAGANSVDLQEEEGWRALEPILIKIVREDSGKVLYEVLPKERLILSRELAYLVTHVLKDDAERWSVLGSIDALELSFPSAVMMDNNSHNDMAWTIGYTPSRVVGVWLRDNTYKAVGGIGEIIDSVPLWSALMENDTQNSPIEGWEEPPGVVSVDVCDPSGLLPTEHCPQVVTEIYLEGTEPVYYDNFYRPIRINKDTGKLATAFTPLDKVEQFVFMLPPPEARFWAQGEGIIQPPTEYDTLQVASSVHGDVGIENPKGFAYIHGLNWISGWMKVEDFSTFRLQYGRGLNPTHWYQIGEDHYELVEQGTLALWDTSNLDGLYALQLIVVDQDRIAQIATQYVTVDNLNPEIEVLDPQPEQEFHLSHDHSFIFEVSVIDNIGIARVELYLDGKRVDTKLEAPFAVQIPISRSGEIELIAKAYDLAGNESVSDVVSISILE